MTDRELDAVVRLFRDAIRDGGAFDRYRDGAATLGGAMTDPSLVDRYESELAEAFGTRYATCVSSGTAAVHAAIAALGLEPGTEIVCSSITDPGAVMPILFQQCVPTFAEHDLSTIVMSAEGVEAALTPYTGAIITTALSGQVCDMDAIMRLARRRGIPVISDVSQAHGSTYRGSRTPPLGDVGVMSLMSGKHMVAGGQGGVVLTDDAGVYWAAKRFADRGKPFGLEATGNVSIGLNYRMTDLEAVVGSVQLGRLPEVMAARRQVMQRIHAGVAGVDGLRAVVDGPEVVMNPWTVMVMVDPGVVGMDALGVAAALGAEGVPARTLSPGLQYRLPYLAEGRTEPFGRLLRGRTVRWTAPDHPNAERIARECVLVAIHEGWSDADADDAAAALRKVATTLRIANAKLGLAS